MIKNLCKTYSRCGKTCDERFNNIKEDRALMLLGERLKRSESQPKSYEKKDPNDLKEVMRGIKSHRKRFKTANNPNISPVFLVQGRDDYYNSIKNHDKVPPCGYYNIENQLKNRAKSIPNFSKKHKSKSKVPRKKIDVPYRTVDKLNVKLPKSQLFHLQLPRPGIETLGHKVNDKRFESPKPMPAISTKCIKVPSPDFSLGTGHNFVLPETVNSRIYNPNYKVVWKNIAGPMVEFEKYTERKPNDVGMMDLEYRKMSFAQIDKSIPNVYFEKKSSRPYSENYPLFMAVRDI